MAYLDPANLAPIGNGHKKQSLHSNRAVVMIAQEKRRSQKASQDVFLRVLCGPFASFALKALGIARQTEITHVPGAACERSVAAAHIAGCRRLRNTAPLAAYQFVTRPRIPSPQGSIPPAP